MDFCIQVDLYQWRPMSSWGNRIMTMGLWFFALLLTQWSCVFFCSHCFSNIHLQTVFMDEESDWGTLMHESFTLTVKSIRSCSMDFINDLPFLDMAFGLHCIQNVLNLIEMIVSRSFSCNTGVLGFWEEKNYPEEHRCFWHFWNVSPPRKELTGAKNESIETFSFYEKRLEY